MKKIGLLTSGGDCQALNVTMRGVAKSLYTNLEQLEIYGFLNGYEGLIYGRYKLLSKQDFSGILTIGGTMLGTSRQPFKQMRVPDKSGLDKVRAMKENYYRLNLDCLVVLGGNGSQKTANLLSEEGLNVIHLPKTIDNDIYGTDITFGFQSAIDVATNVIDCIHTTAASHNRVFIVEIMGHKVGWLTLYAGIAGGADIILLPEIPYDIDSVMKSITARSKAGKGFTILAVAEGAISKKNASLSKKEYKEKMAKSKFPSVSYELAYEISNRLGSEVRVVVPGHTQRGGTPNAFDRVLSTRIGAAAAEAILEEDYGCMIAMINGEIKRVPLKNVSGKLKTVNPGCELIKEAKMIGISLVNSIHDKRNYKKIVGKFDFKIKNIKGVRCYENEVSSYTNRELSWLQFNERVLNEAGNPEVPLAERLSFISIFQTNLDEFFMVRVGTLLMQMQSSENCRK